MVTMSSKSESLIETNFYISFMPHVHQELIAALLQHTFTEGSQLVKQLGNVEHCSTHSREKREHGMLHFLMVFLGTYILLANTSHIAILYSVEQECIILFPEKGTKYRKQ